MVADPSYSAVGTHVQCFSEAWVKKQQAYFVPVPAPDDELLELAEWPQRRTVPTPYVVRCACR